MNPLEEEKVLEYPLYKGVDRTKVIWEQGVERDRKLGYRQYRDLYRGRIRPEILPADLI